MGDGAGLDQFEVVDVSEWAAAGEEQLGTKPKQWQRAPDGRRWLWKAVTVNHTSSGGYLRGDDWAERIVTEVARTLDVPVATTELARRDGDLGTISLAVVDGSEQLVHGNELLAEVDVIGTDPHDRTGYTVEAVKQALIGAVGGVPGASAFDCFVGYLVLDAVVGNTDRHQENWAVIEDPSGTRRLAPSFDHASSLGFALSEKDKAGRLSTRDGNRTPEMLAAKARGRFEKQPHPVDVAVGALDMVETDEVSDLLGRVRALDIAGIVDRVPPDRMSVTSRQFALRVVESNRARLLSHPTLTMDP